MKFNAKDGSDGKNHSFLIQNGSLWVQGFNNYWKVGIGDWHEWGDSNKIVDSVVAGISAGIDHSV